MIIQSYTLKYHANPKLIRLQKYKKKENVEWEIIFLLIRTNLPFPIFFVPLPALLK